MRPIRRLVQCLLPVAVLFGGVGCAAFSNPTTWPSVPVRRLPDELLGKPREEQLDLPQPLLRQKGNREHRIDAGDTLGIVLERILGEPNQAPPVQIPQPGATSSNIGLGYPIPVLEDGTVSLPLIDPVQVRGMSLREAQDTIKKAYLDKEILKEPVKILVTLLRPRHYRVLVVRQDSGGTGQSFTYGGNLQFTAKRGSGVVLELPAYENDILTVLTRSGGFPGNDAQNEVLIQRGMAKEDLETMPSGPFPGIETTRIPLRLRPGEPIPFKPEDVIVNNGDIVFIRSRETELYYTAGLIPPGEWPIPRDYDLDVLEAIAQVRGPMANGGVNFNNLAGNIVGSGVGGPSPSQVTILRKCPGNRQISIRVDLNRAMQDPRERILVQSGDVLILQETLGEALTRYLTGSIRSTFIGQYLRSSSVSGTASIQSP